MEKPGRKDISSEQVQRLLKMAGSDPKVQDSLRKGDLNQVLNSLPSKDAQAVRSLLGDPIRLKQVLASPEAQQLMKQLKKS